MPKSDQKPLDMKDKRVISAVDMTFAGRFTWEQIAEKCSVSPRTYAYWLKHPDFQAALEAKRADFHASIESVTFADKARRIHALNDAALLALTDLEENTRDKETRPSRDGDIVNETFNQKAMSEFRAALDDIAKELGERAKQVDVTSKGEQVRAVFVLPDLIDNGESLDIDAVMQRQKIRENTKGD